MSESRNETKSAAEVIVEQLETEPPNNVDPHPRLFDDLEDKPVHENLFKLWRKGIIEAEWVEEDEETAWWLTKFGVELHEKGLTEIYIEATETEIELDASPSVMIDPKEVV